MAKYIFVLCMFFTTVNSQKCDWYGFMGCLEDLYGIIRFNVSSQEELDTECSKTRESVTLCFERMKLDCETKNIEVGGVKKYLKAVCEKGSFQDEYLKHTECLSKHEVELSICNEFADKHEMEVMKFICCEHNIITECTQEKAGIGCGSEASSFVLELDKRTKEIFPKLLCEDMDQCDGGTRPSAFWNILRALLITLLAVLLK